MSKQKQKKIIGRNLIYLEEELLRICAKLNSVQRAMFTNDNPHNEGQIIEDFQAANVSKKSYFGDERQTVAQVIRNKHVYQFNPDLYDKEIMDFKLQFGNRKMINKKTMDAYRKQDELQNKTALNVADAVKENYLMSKQKFFRSIDAKSMGYKNKKILNVNKTIEFSDPYQNYGTAQQTINNKNLNQSLDTSTYNNEYQDRFQLPSFPHAAKNRQNRSSSIQSGSIFKPGSIQRTMNQSSSDITKLPGLPSFQKKANNFRGSAVNRSVDQIQSKMEGEKESKQVLNPYHDHNVSQFLTKIDKNRSRKSNILLKRARDEVLHHNKVTESLQNAPIFSKQSSVNKMLTIKKSPSLFQMKPKKQVYRMNKEKIHGIFDTIRQKEEEDRPIIQAENQNDSYMDLMKQVIQDIQNREQLKYLEENEKQLFDSVADFGDKQFHDQAPPDKSQNNSNPLAFRRRGNVAPKKVNKFEDRSFYSQSMKTMGQTDYQHDVEIMPEVSNDVPNKMIKDNLLQRNYIYIRNKYVAFRVDTNLKSIADNILEKSGQNVRRRNQDHMEFQQDLKEKKSVLITTLITNPQDLIEKLTKELDDDLEKVARELRHDIWDGNQMTKNKVKKRVETFQEFLGKHAHIAPIDIRKPTQSSSESSQDSEEQFKPQIDFEQMNQKQKRKKLKELYKIDNHDSSDNYTDSDRSQGSDTRREMYRSESENDLDFYDDFQDDKSQKSQTANTLKRQGTDKLSAANSFQQRFTGQNAILNSMHKYQASQRLAQLTDIKGKKHDNPLVQYYSEINKQKLIPRTLGFVHKKQPVTELNCSNQMLNPNYVDALTKGVSVAKYIRNLNLKNTKISNKGAISIIQGMDRTRIKILDMSYNPAIQADFYELLGEICDEPDCQLEVLNLEANMMGDRALELMALNLIHARSLRVLNLSKNDITDIGVKWICKIIYHCSTLKGLFLHYNRILGKGGYDLARVLTDNSILEVLDVSFNSICGGITTNDEVKATQLRDMYAKAWSECFKKNTALIHVDISHNNLRTIEIEIIADGLKHNHSILGIHLRGNEGNIDAQGFVSTLLDLSRDKFQFGNAQAQGTVASTSQSLASSLILSRMEENPSRSTGIVKNSIALDMHVADNCWICEGWRQVTFKFTPGVSYKYKVDPSTGELIKHDPFQPIHLHLEIDDFKGDLMLPDDPENPKVYESTRYVPPGMQHRYFFSLKGEQFVASDQLIRKNRKDVQVTKAFGQGKGQVFEKDDTEFDVGTLPKLNYLPAQRQNFDPYTPQAILAMMTKPRIVKYLGNREHLKSAWQFKLSVFKNYKPDTLQLLEKCFEFDWTFIESKIEYLIKDEKDRIQVKAYMKSNYKMLRDAYKLTSGEDAQGNSMSIGKNSFSQLMQSCGDLVDGKTLKLTDVDIGLIAVKAADAKRGNKLIPVDQLIRYNFLEVMIRLAEQKYIKSGLAKTFSEAISTMMSTYIQPIFLSTDSHIWRKNELWREEVDLSFKRQYRVVQRLYAMFSGRFALPGAPQFVSPIEFAEMVETSGVVSDFFTFKEIYPIWNLSMMTSRDEINNDKHLNMNFTEFIEAIGRVASKLSIPHLVDDDFEPEDLQNAAMAKAWGERPLEYKLESFLLTLAQNCLGEKIFKQESGLLLMFKDEEHLYANNFEVSNMHNKVAPGYKELLDDMNKKKKEQEMKTKMGF